MTPYDIEIIVANVLSKTRVHWHALYHRWSESSTLESESNLDLNTLILNLDLAPAKHNSTEL